MRRTRATSSQPAIRRIPRPPAAAPAAGGRGISGSRLVDSLGVRGWVAGGAVEVEAWSVLVLATVVLSSVLQVPVELQGRSAVFSACAAPRSRGVLSLQPVSMVVELAFEDLCEDAVARVGVVRGAGWRRFCAEGCRLPGRRRALPSPKLVGGGGGGFRRQSVLLDGEDARVQEDLVVILLCSWTYL